MRPALYPVLFGNRLRPVLDLLFTSGTLDSRVTYSGASLATLTDATGAIAYKPHNLLTYSEQFDNAAWSKTGTTVTVNATTAPDGQATADKVVELATFGIHTTNQAGTTTVGATYTFSIRAKAAERRYIVIGQDSVGTGYFEVDLQAGSFTASTVGTYLSRSITSEANGFYKVTITYVAANTGATGFIFLGNASGISISYAGDGTSGVYVWGAQLNIGPLQPYYPTTGAAYYGPRFTYDPVTHAALGLLIEEQRTNLLTWSEAFGNAAWSGVNVTVTNVAGAPDGSSNLNKVQATAAAATLIRQNATVAATAATFSVYVKQGSGATDGNGFILRNATTATILLNVTVNYSTGVVTYVTGSTGVTLTDVGGGMWRLVMTATSGITSGNDIQAYAFYPGNSETAGEYVYAWGAQLEAGAFATSYIPTTSASVTRAADSATMTGSNFSSWFNATNGTMAFEAISSNTEMPGHEGVVTFDQDGNNTIGIGRRYAGGGSTNVGMFVFVGGVTQAYIQTGTVTPGTAYKVAARYALNNFAESVNGGAPSTDIVGTLPGAITQMLIGRTYASEYLNGTIARLRYYNTALTNAQLQALTT